MTTLLTVDADGTPDAPGGLLVPGAVGLTALATGFYWTPPHASTTSATRGNGNLYVTPMHVRKKLTIAALICEITGSGSTGAVTRLGIFNSQANGLPGTVLLDNGTTDSTVAAAVLEEAISGNQILTPGKYWLGGVLQGNPGTQPTYRITSATQAYDIVSSTASQVTLGGLNGYQIAGVTGALPDLTGATLNPTGSCIVVGVKGA